MDRRTFLKTAAAAGLLPGLLRAQTPSPFATTLRKALLAKIADEATCARIAAAGFAGVELMQKDVTFEQARQGRLIAEKAGIRIHSFMGGWGDFNNPDSALRQKSIDDFKRMIRLTAAYGASSILVVPCRVGGAMPKPSQFKIDYDPTTLVVKTVVEGDNAPFADYIRKQNDATTLTRAAVEELIPVAAEEGVIIGLENVWNNLWVKPALAAAFIRSFDSPWVRAYLDLGNHVRYAPTEEWLHAMKGMLVKLHIKDFLVDRAVPNEGKFVPIGKGSIDWVSVRKAIDAAGYNGWVSIESDGYTDTEHARLLDNIFAGKGAVL